jgi:hypothetical protein
MDAVLKAEIQEIIELVKTVPESLQLRTLELLLQDALNRTEGKKEKKEREPDEKSETAKEEKKSAHLKSGLHVGALPMRVKAFMKKHAIAGQQLEKLFHIEGEQYEPIWSLNIGQSTCMHIT